MTAETTTVTFADGVEYVGEKIPLVESVIDEEGVDWTHVVVFDNDTAVLMRTDVHG